MDTRYEVRDISGAGWDCIYVVDIGETMRREIRRGGGEVVEIIEKGKNGNQ